MLLLVVLPIALLLMAMIVSYAILQWFTRHRVFYHIAAPRDPEAPAPTPTPHSLLNRWSPFVHSATPASGSGYGPPSSADHEVTPYPEVVELSAQLDRYFDRTTGRLQPRAMSSATLRASSDADMNENHPTSGWVSRQFNKGLEMVAGYYDRAGRELQRRRESDPYAQRKNVARSQRQGERDGRARLVASLGSPGAGSALLERRRSRWWRMNGGRDGGTSASSEEGQKDVRR